MNTPQRQIEDHRHEVPLRAGPLSEEQTRAVLTAGAAAPSAHNAQPWRFGVRETGIDVYADSARALPATDPDSRELRMSCGAAAFNLRLAVLAQGYAAAVALLPAPSEPQLLARVDIGVESPTPVWADRLSAALPRRRTNRRPFLDVAVPARHRAALVAAGEAEGAWLHAVADRHQLVEIADLVREAERRQRQDPAVQEELHRWTGRTDDRPDGVPLSAGGPRPRPHDLLAMRDLTDGHAADRAPGRDFEESPLLLVLSTPADREIDHVRAGLALQRLLLVATDLGLAMSFLAQPIEVTDVRRSLGTLVGGWGSPQMVLRAGFGGAVPATPRRAVDELTFPGDAARS
jgi:nitroreductase